jgi:formamidopyrimidine-DNA glycosylase
MPELPEVETVRRALNFHLSNARVAKVGGRSIGMRRFLDVDRLAELLPMRQFVSARRRGKFLLLDFDPPGTLLIHLGMSGRLQIGSPSGPRLAHTHLVLDFEDGRELRFADPRRFGLADWLEAGEEAHDSSLIALGLEPLDTHLPVVLPPLFRARRSCIKTLLMDQRLVVGVGNIYAAEALWRAGIRPTRPGNRTSVGRLRNLATKVREVLEEAISEGGTTLRDYAAPDDELGYFAVRLQVYGRQGQPCTRCGSELRAEVIGGRTTAWCRRCQR